MLRVGVSFGTRAGTAAAVAVIEPRDGGLAVTYLDLAEDRVMVHRVAALAEAAGDVAIRANKRGPLRRVPNVEEISTLWREARKRVRQGIRQGKIVAGGRLAQSELEAKVYRDGQFFEALALAALPVCKSKRHGG